MPSSEPPTWDEILEGERRQLAAFQVRAAARRAGRSYRAGEDDHRSTYKILHAVEALMAEFPTPLRYGKK